MGRKGGRREEGEEKGREGGEEEEKEVLRTLEPIIMRMSYSDIF